eukprot:m.601846 g.601846  ORF g.601846 m.601846 type:complete len:83 (+) comp58091_c0_seq16:32-280(+)
MEIMTMSSRCKSLWLVSSGSWFVRVVQPSQRAFDSFFYGQPAKSSAQPGTDAGQCQLRSSCPLLLKRKVCRSCLFCELGEPR